MHAISVTMGSITMGLGSPFLCKALVVPQLSFIQPKYLPKRPVFNCISEPHLWHERVGPSYPLILKAPSSTSKPSQSGLLEQTCSL